MKREMIMVDNKSNIAQDFIKIITKFKKIGFSPNPNYPLRQSEYMLLFTLSNCISEDLLGMKVSELSGILNITPAAVTHMVNSLEKEGYIDRVSSENDRRIIYIKPTGKGNMLIGAMNANFYEILNQTINFVGEDDAKEFIRILWKVTGFIEQKFENNEL
jgi:DNA-binding MarR family transcriptional regulator